MTYSPVVPTVRMPQMFVAALLVLVLAACGTTPPEPQPVEDAVLSVAVAVNTSDIYIGGTYQATATVAVEGDAPTTVTWSSSHPEVLSVNSAGQLLAVAAGNAVITATSTFDAGEAASIPVTVTSALAGRSVLYYAAGTSSGSFSALAALTLASHVYGFELETNTTGTYTPGMYSSDYDIVFHYVRNSSPSQAELDELHDYATRGGRLVFGHWNRLDTGMIAFVGALGAPFGSYNNYSQVTITDDELSRGLGSRTMALTNPGAYGTFNVNHMAIGGNEVWAQYGADGSAAVVAGLGGKAIVVGFFENALETTNGQRFFLNLFNKVARGLAQ